MKYFVIHTSLDIKVMGHIPQVKEVRHNCHIWNDPMFINNFPFKNIEFTPITSYPVLDEKANKTDLIEASGIGFNSNLLVSNRLKEILDNRFVSDFQYFQTSIFHHGVESDNYWLVHPSRVCTDVIDYDRSEIFLMENTFTKVEKLNITNANGYQQEKQRIETLGFPFSIYIDVLRLRDDLDDDFFVLTNIEGGYKFFVSEILRKKIEDEHCTGIEFKPYELSLNDWLGQDGERRRVYGKT